MRNQEWDATLAQLYSLNLAELVLSLLGGDAVDGEAALGVVDEAEVLARLLDTDDIHEAGRVGGVGADLAIDLDQALHDNGLGLAGVERILQSGRGKKILSVHCLFSITTTADTLSVTDFSSSHIPVADEHDERHAVAQLVRTGRGLGGIETAELVEQPVLRR